MKTKQFLILITALFISLVTTSSISAQSERLVEIKNNSGEKRKICMYKDQDINLIAKRCFELKIGESVNWNREGDDSAFKVKIFKSQLIDKYLYSRSLPYDTRRIIIGQGGRFGFSRQEAKTKKTKYLMQVCNNNFNEINIMLAFGVNNATSAHGWWRIKKNDCATVATSKLMQQTAKIDFGNVPNIYFYAKEFGVPSPKVWSGGEDGKNVCINTKKAFALNQVISTEGGGLQMIGCGNYGEELYQFRELENPNLRGDTFYLTF